MLTFDGEKIISQFQSCADKFIEITNNHPKLLQKIKQDFEKQHSEYRQRGYLTVAFIGEYSAGKSTIISALTGRKDIKISADIATDHTSEYDWNGIKLIDTPGLYTERKNHDEITLQKMKESDILIFTLTHSLFDSITAKNFKELAYNYKYKNKMMLVVNKLSSEAGDDNEKIENYAKSLQDALTPNLLNSFVVSYIDALDYIDGVDTHDAELQKLSRFDTFIADLNAFTNENSAYAKLDTPIRILRASIEDAVQSVVRDNNEDDAKLLILNRLSKAMNRRRRSLEGELDGIVLDLHTKIQAQSSKLTSLLGSKSNLEDESRKAEKSISKYNQEAAESVEQAINSCMEDIKPDLQKIFENRLLEEFILNEDEKFSVNASDAATSETAKKAHERFRQFEQIADTCIQSFGNFTVKKGASVGMGFLKNADVSGSVAHKAVLTVGHKIGYKFIPYQAIGITKAFGNLLKVAGPIFLVISLVFDVKDVQQDEENARKLADARTEINSTFKGIANDIEGAFKKQVKNFFKEKFQPIEEEIKKIKDSEMSVIAQTNSLVADLNLIHKELDAILQNIY